MLGVFAVGVGIGSLTVARFLRDASLLNYVAAAGLGVSVFTADFAWTASHAGICRRSRHAGHGSGWHLLGDLLLLSACGGAYSVPLYVLLQERSAPTHRARMVAANNVMNAVASVLAAGLTAGLYAAGMGAPGFSSSSPRRTRPSRSGFSPPCGAALEHERRDRRVQSAATFFMRRLFI